jgi:phosphoglycerate dehydrogenase-like enzyme
MPGARRVAVELAGRRLGVVGYGGIGREVTRLGRCLGMNVVAHDALVVDGDVEMVLMTELLEVCDVVSLHMPLDETTRGMIGRGELSRMRPGAVLINTARGGIVDEEALAGALADERIAGAAFGCFAHEPGGHSLLLELDSFVSSPHAGEWHTLAPHISPEVTR